MENHRNLLLSFSMGITQSQWNTLVIFLVFCIIVGLGTAFTFFRIYLRTELKGYFLFTIACGILLIYPTILFILFFKKEFPESIINSLFKLLQYLSMAIILTGAVMLGTIENGKVKEAFKNLSYFQRIIGNISPDFNKKEKYRTSVKRYQGFIMGILTIAIGEVLVVLNKFFNLHIPDLSFYVFMCLFMGIAVIVFSLFLPKRSNKNE